MRLTEREKQEIFVKYSGGTSDSLLTHLKRHYTVHEHYFSWSSEPEKYIKVGDKIRPLRDNKKYLVNLISSILEDEWVSLGIPTIRKTVKKYLDGIK